jgi:hypothetical protein
MHWLAAKFMPGLLSEKQKENCVNMCQDFWERLGGGPKFLSKTITGDETLVYGYAPETKQLSSQWKSPSSPCLLKRQDKFAQIWRAQPLLVGVPHPTFKELCIMDFFHKVRLWTSITTLTPDSDGVKRKEIKCHHDSTKIAGCTCLVSNNWLQEMFLAVVWLLSLLYKS